MQFDKVQYDQSIDLMTVYITIKALVQNTHNRHKICPEYIVISELQGICSHDILEYFEKNHLYPIYSNSHTLKKLCPPNFTNYAFDFQENATNPTKMCQEFLVGFDEISYILKGKLASSAPQFGFSACA